MSGFPDVSIVLITFNDAVRLLRALASLSNQTLRNLEIIVVDDASTDGTAGVVETAISADPRIRYVRLDVNSGGCSGPRNRGIREAIGTWVMFCDSDDEYERHAAKNLLLAVERSDGDLGCGVVERVEVKTGLVKRWRADLHEPGVLESIDERPDLIADTVSVNKIYRREWLNERGIDFPEGVLYEDQLFTLKAFAEARRICVISETVYRWYVDRLGSDQSITQRRHELRNVRDRIEVNRLIDEYLDGRGLTDLGHTKTRKFLSHDLYLYLSTLLELSDDDATAVAGELAPYVATLDLQQARFQRPALRVATYHLLIGDLDGVRRAMRFIRWSSVVDVPLVIDRDSKVLWGCAHLAAGPSFQGLGPDWWLDVSALGLDRATTSQRRWCHRLTSIDGSRGTWSVEGTTVDAFGDFGRATSVELVLVLATRVMASLPLTMSRSDPGSHGDLSLGTSEWQWRGKGRWSEAPRTGIRPPDRGFLGIRIVIDGVANVMPVRVSESMAPVRALPGVRSFVGLRTYPGEHGVVRWVAGRHSRSSRLLGRLRRWHSSLDAVIAGGAGAIARRVGERLPTAPLVVFIGHGDHPVEFSGQAHSISAALLERRPDVRQAWQAVHNTATNPSISVRRSWRLARARWWVLDTALPATMRSPAHGGSYATAEAVPVVRMGPEDPDWDITAPSRRRGARSLPRRWDGSGAMNPEAAHRELDLPSSRVNVLYEPLGDECLIDLPAFVERFGGRVHLLIASGSGVAVDIPSVLRSSVRDVSARAAREIAYAASDVLVTDFSPVMADFASAGRPVIVFAPDFDRFVSRTKGTVVDLTEAGPGPVTRSMVELVAELTALLDRGLVVAEPYYGRSRRFAERVAPMTSADEFVDDMLGGA
ncbi:MAG: glycosyltransferase [Actinobacteria bacterium]|nr:glycosyltransferase [Actinomycetota bacterium]